MGSIVKTLTNETSSLDYPNKLRLLGAKNFIFEHAMMVSYPAGALLLQDLMPRPQWHTFCNIGGMFAFWCLPLLD
jgi:hypothetical protein